MNVLHKLPVYLSVVILGITLYACGGGGSSGDSGPTRSFLMGTSPFFATSTAFPDWRFENLDDKDLLSIHGDDFWGVPWEQCNAAGCTPPQAWVTQWTNFSNTARDTGKSIYLSLSPLGGRKTLAPRLDANGNKVENWAPVDANGCYTFASDPNANTYKTAYISYMKYLIDLVGPDYVSPAIEMNIQFTQCPLQKAAWLAWYRDVHTELKVSYPSIVMFPTFQMEHMYGIADAQAACVIGTTLDTCFDNRLAEVLTIPGDRIAFSIYPIAWTFWPDYSFSYPTDTYARVKAETTRKIWVSETGWAAVNVLQSYQHGVNSSCGADLLPVASANNTNQDDYLRWLLDEAQTQEFEAVIWWLNRDYLDGTVATTCPCDPATSDTCILADAFYTAAGDFGETVLRVFGNMALRNYDGSPRPSHSVWREIFERNLSPVP